MKFIALISGGKDSLFNILSCIAENHELVALANLRPKFKDELDSYMYQTVGHDGIDLYAEALGLPLYRRDIEGSSLEQGVDYNFEKYDEVEDLYQLLLQIKNEINFEGVSVGAILSDYQRVRVENVCVRLGLTPLSYLWRRDQKELLDEMIKCSVEAILIKVAALGLLPDKHLGKNLCQIQNHMIAMEQKFGLNPCGEGGEYETFTLDCPLFEKRIIVDKQSIVSHSEDAFAPVAFIKFNRMHLEEKKEKSSTFFETVQALPIKTSKHIIEEANSAYSCSSSLMIDSASSNTNHLQFLENKIQKVYLKITNNGWFTISGITAWNDDCNLQKNAKHAMDKLVDILKSSELTTKHLVAVHLYVSNLSDFSPLNQVYKSYFSNNPPIRICVEACFPENLLFSLDCIGYKSISDTSLKPEESCRVKSLSRHTMHVQGLSHWAPANIGPYSQCIQVGELLYVAGQIPLVPATMQIVEGGTGPQAYLSLKHVQSILTAMCSNCSMDCICLAVSYVTNSAFIPVAKKLWKNHENILLNSVKDKASYVAKDRGLFYCVVVPALPRAAHIEWEVYASQHRIDQVEERRHCQKGSIDGALSNCVCQVHNCEDTTQEIISFVCITELNYKKQHVISEDEIGQILRDTLLTIKETLKQFHFASELYDNLLILKVFFIGSVLHFSDLVKTFPKVCLEVYGSEDVITPVFVPVHSLQEDNHVIAIVH